MKNQLHPGSLWLSLAAASVLAGCGGDADSAGEFFDEYLTLYCTKVQACESTWPANAPITHEEFYGPDVASCKRLFVTPAEVQASADAGRIIFDATAAATCMSKTEAIACADWWDTSSPRECGSATVGTLPLGGACTINIDCGSRECDDGVCVD